MRAEVVDVWRCSTDAPHQGATVHTSSRPHKAANRVSRRPLTSSSSDRGADLVVKGKTLARRALSGKNHDICVSSWEKGSHPMWVTAHRRTYGTSRTSGRLRTHRARGRPSRRTLNVAPGHKSMMRVSASRRRAQLEADASHQLTVWGSAVMRSWKKAKSGEVYDPAPKRSLPLNLAARRVKTVPDAPDGSGR